MEVKIKEFYDNNEQFDLNGSTDLNVMKKASKIMRDAEESMKAEDLADILEIAVDLYTCALLLQESANEEPFKQYIVNIIDLECYKLYVQGVLSQIEKAKTRHDVDQKEFEQIIINMTKARWQRMNEKEKTNNILWMQKELKKELNI